MRMTFILIFKVDAPSPPSPLLTALEHHYEELVDYVRRRFGGRGFARDVVHDVCVELMDRPPAEEIRAPLALLRRMSSNRAIDHTRADATRRARIEAVAEPPDERVHHDDGAQLLSGSQQLMALMQVIEGLPSRARQVFLLHRVHDMPQQEIAQTLGISRNMVAQHMARAMRSVVTEWEPARHLGDWPSREAIVQEARTQRQATRRGRAKAAAQAAVLALAVATLWIADPRWSSEPLQTAVGERASWTLADGSRIDLNTDTRLRVDMHLRSRRFVLTQGEARFEATHTWRAFLVQAGETTVRDIGTVFNVRHLSDGVRVSVVEGAVEVRHGADQQVLVAPQQVDTRPGGLAPVRPDGAPRAQAWREGRLVFDATPLAEVAAELSRYRARPVHVADAAAGRLRLSGAYDAQALEGLIDALPLSLPVSVRRLPDGSVSIASRP